MSPLDWDSPVLETSSDFVPDRDRISDQVEQKDNVSKRGHLVSLREAGSSSSSPSQLDSFVLLDL